MAGEGLRALAPRLATAVFFSAAACACDPTVIIGALGVQADAQGGGQGDAQGDATFDAQGDATVDAQGDALGDSQGDAQADAQGCPGSGADAGPASDPDASVGPWTTGFENAFCDYAPPLGFCYAAGPGSYSLVTSPVHSGKYAAAFAAQGVGDAGVGPGQARCVEQGVFPSAAYYGAWYYVPAQAVNAGTWNLLHFQGSTCATGCWSSLWDVSLVNTGSSSGPLHVVLFDFLNGMSPNANAVPPIPIGQWFHLEVYFKRANDTTGALTLLQDGVTAATLTGLVTDPTAWGQWYVGNWADHLMPPASTVYVDDVTIGFTQ
jgi:hypothetical protein